MFSCDLDEILAPIQVLSAGEGKGYGIFAQENIPKYTCLLRSKAMKLFDAGSDTLDNAKMLYEKEQFALVVKNLYPRTMDDLPKDQQGFGESLNDYSLSEEELLLMAKIKLNVINLYEYEPRSEQERKGSLGLFAMPSFFNHASAWNVSINKNVTRGECACFAICDIKKGTELTIWYGTPETCDNLYRVPSGHPSMDTLKQFALFQNRQDRVACYQCGRNSAKKVCVVCRRARYCDKTCQRAHWILHKAFCKTEKS